MLALRQTEWQRVNLKTTALETLYGGEIVLSTYLVKRNHPVILSHQRSATVSLEKEIYAKPSKKLYLSCIRVLVRGDE